MDREQINTQHVIPRLLAGQLTAAEEAAFDDFALQHPEIYREVEQTFRFKEGLALLHDQRGVDSQVRTRSWRSLAAAAAILLACGTLLWTHFRAAPRPVVLAAATENFTRSPARTAPLLGSYILARSRNPTGRIDLDLPAKRGITQLRLLPSNPGDPHYTAHLTRLSPNGRSQPVSELSGLVASSDDLYVTLYIDSSNLPAGDYEISLDPQPTPSVSASHDHFILRLP